MCAAGFGSKSTISELRDSTFAVPLCFLGVFLVLALMGDDGDAMGSVMDRLPAWAITNVLVL